MIDIDRGGPGDPAVDVRIRPDAHNTGLAAAGEPTRYYFEPPRVTVATRSGSSDLDFSATVMLQAPVGPQPIYLGGSCTFACTATLPADAAARIVQKLADHDHPDPPARIASLFAHRNGGPAPELLMVPITANTVSCVVEHPPTGPGPLLMSVQGGPGGGIDIQARSSFLVSFSPAAAEAVVTNLRDAAAPPFLVRNVLTEQFDTGQATVVTDADIDIGKLHAVFAATVPPEEPWPGGEAAGAAYRAAVATGAITTRVTESRPADTSHGTAPTGTGTTPMVGPMLLDPAASAWISNTNELRKAVFRLAGGSLFDVTAAPAPEPGQGGRAAPAWWSAIFGDAQVTLRGEPPPGSVHLSERLITHGAVTMEHMVEGGLTEVAEAARTELDKYLTVIAV
ncbi:hypothetical protein AB0A69_33515 [Streptomyces sp. NPDC045431]|uniref:hypothetical protein n=1 Tax=Streptomyces sp. NPDC045431 TaxID=3155613 RepID=UPI0033E73A0B